tara:strand:- start:8032 stop:8673 length:642 start_codon:yes stop_codon:yes gene_type:complete
MTKLFLTFFFLFPVFCSAQVIDNSAVENLNQGTVNFIEGEFAVYLADTVSPAFIRQQFAALDIRISFNGIEPIIISLANTPSDSTLKKLSSHPKVLAFKELDTEKDYQIFEQELRKKKLSKEAYQQARLDFLSSQSTDSYLITFDYSVNDAVLKKIMREFKDVAYFIKQNFPRIVNVEVVPGTELEKMDTIETLPYIKFTAMIATPPKIPGQD